MTKRKILIVDDEPDLAKLVVEILQDEGYNATAVYTGEEAIQKVKELLPDLILLDWQLPDTEGVDVCRIIKNDPETEYIPIIMLTSLGSEVHKIRGLEAGADDYITKPFSSGELLARLRATFRRMQREEKIVESKIAQLQKYLPKEMLEKIVARGPRAQEGEKRIVTVLIADLSGFTAIAEELSPEKVTQLINDCFKPLVDVITQYGGTIDKFMGDAIMALFGAPVAHEDDPSRALHSALMMKHKLKEFNETHKEHLPRPFEIRIGINTGVVVAGSVGADAHLEYTVMGDTVNVTSRLQTAATPGQILVSEDTHFYTKDSFLFSQPQTITVKGKKELITVYELLGTEKTLKLFNEIDGRITKHVGHKRELNLLKNYVDRLADGTIKQGIVLSVFGPKGIGKSRIVHELISYIISKNLLCIQLWCLPYHDIIIYDYNSKCIIELQELLQVINQKLQQSEQPLIVIIDNIESAKEQEFTLFKEVFSLAAKSQMLVWCLHRLEFSHPCANEPYYRQIEMTQLTLDDAREMLDYILGDSIPPDVKSMIMNLAEGIPLYIEETVKYLIKEEIIKKDITGKWQLSKEITTIEVPPVIQCLVMSQLDSLGEKTKEILQIASVIGREFRYKILRALVKNEDELKTELSRLTKIGIITEKSVLTERVFAFKHSVTHQVVYGTVLESFRNEIKSKIDKYLETESRM